MAMNDYVPRRGNRPGGISIWKDARFRREAAKIAPLIDQKFYFENNVDVAASGLDASLHYAKYGWREGRDPSPSFSTKGYLAANPKVALKGTNPLLHFIQSGAAPTQVTEAEAPLAEHVALVAEHLDQNFYRQQHPEYDVNGLSAAEHYSRYGWREGADPAPEFSTSYYLMTNPDIRESGVNPYWHYLIAGQHEGRLPSHPGGWRHTVLSRQTSFKDHCEKWLRDDAEPELLAPDAVAQRIAQSRRTDGLLVSFGHDDYRSTPGGVQLCIEIEERDAVSKGFDYLNLHPWQPLPKLADANADPILCLVLNGETIGAARASDLIVAAPRLGKTARSSGLVIHHLAGHAPETVTAVADGLGLRTAYFWLHDYFSLCTSYALQRNNVSRCSVPDAASNACEICLYGPARKRQLSRLERMFKTLDVTVISPSDVALEFWKSRATVTPAAELVHAHVTLSPGAADTSIKSLDQRPARIAFVGTPAPHKGWPVFTELRRRLSADARYEFLFFGMADPGADGIVHYEAHVRADDPESTMRAIAKQNVDLVLHWAHWSETFSFSTFEALGAGAFIITNVGSGNVAAAVETFGRGAVLEDTEALFSLARKGGLAELASEARKRRATERLDATFSGMTFDIFPGEGVT